MEEDILNYAVEEAGNYDTDSLFWSWFFPGAEQREQFGQQVALSRDQAKYANTQGIEDRFKTLEKLGVNPFTIAQGLAGSQGAAVTAPAPPSQPSNNSIPEALQSVGGAADALSSARERNTLLDERKKNLISDTYLKYKTAGYNDEMAKGLAIANAFLPTEKFLGLLSLDASIDKLHAEYKSLMQGIKESKKRVEELDAQIELAHATRDLQKQLEAEAEKRALLIEAQTKEQNWLNTQMELYGVNPRNPIESNVFLAGVREGRTSYNGQLGIVRDIQYNNATGTYDSQQEHSYDIAYNEALGKAAASWFERPNSLWSTVYDFSKRVASNLVAGKITREQASQEIRRIKGFKESFNEFRNNLKNDASSKKREFLRYKKEHGNDYAGIRQKRGEWMRALNLYEEFDEDDYVDILLNQK